MPTQDRPYRKRGTKASRASVPRSFSPWAGAARDRVVVEGPAAVAGRAVAGEPAAEGPVAPVPAAAEAAAQAPARGGRLGSDRSCRSWGSPSLSSCRTPFPGFVWFLAGGVASATSVEEALELGLRHLRATVDPTILRFLVELSVGPSSRSGVGTQPAAPARGQVVHRGATRRPGFAGSRAFLVDGSRGDLLRRVLRPSSLSQPFLDVFVLTLALLAPRLLWHVQDLPPLVLRRTHSTVPAR